MEGVEELSRALVTLAQKILQREEQEGLGTIKLLLLEVDGARFKSMFDRWGCKTYVSLRHALDHYYLTSFEERIRWDNPAITLYRDEFVQAFLLVLDLALRSGRSAFIEGILALSQSCQETLQPFVKAVTERQNFVERAEGERRNDDVLQLLSENQQLKRLCDQWMNKYQQLKSEHDDLKIVHERNNEELHLLRQDHQLLNEIGGSGTVEEALQKIRHDFADYERMLDRLKKELEEKKTALGQREEDLRTLQASFKARRSLEKVEELELAHQRIKNLEESLQKLKGQEEQTRTQLEESRQLLRQRDVQIDSLKIKVSSLEGQAQKYSNVRKLHNQYRDKIMKQLKETRE